MRERRGPNVSWAIEKTDHAFFPSVRAVEMKNSFTLRCSYAKLGKDKIYGILDVTF